MKQINKTSVALFVLIGGLMLSVAGGCSASGPAFTPVADVPAGKGVVYVYRPYRFFGSAVTYAVRTGDKVIATARNGGYLYYIADPGELEIWAETEARSAVTVDIKPKKDAYVKAAVGWGFWVGRPKLSIVPEEQGKDEIKSCKLQTD